MNMKVNVKLQFVSPTLHLQDEKRDDRDQAAAMFPPPTCLVYIFARWTNYEVDNSR